MLYPTCAAFIVIPGNLMVFYNVPLVIVSMNLELVLISLHCNKDSIDFLEINCIQLFI